MKSIKFKTRPLELGLDSEVWIYGTLPATKDKALCMIEKCKKHYKRYYKDIDNMPIYLNLPFTAFNDFVCEGLYEMVYYIEYNNDTLEYAFEQCCKNRNKKHHNRK